MSKLKNNITAVEDASTRDAPPFFSQQVSNARRFYLNPKSSAAALAVVSGGCENTRPDYQINRTGFDYYSVEFVARGRGTLTLEGEMHVLGPGHVFAYGPGISHAFASDPQDPLIKYFVDFTGRQARRLVQAPLLALGSAAQTSAPQDVLQLFEQLIDAGLRHTRLTPRICTAALEHLLLRIGDSITSGTAGAEAFSSYQRCRQYMEKNYLQTNTVTDIAAVCDLDPAYICRLFSRFCHQSPYHFLIRLKMLDAAERLRGGGKLVKEVAAELRFSDQYSFSRAFRRVFGVSPRKFMALNGRTRPL